MPKRKMPSERAAERKPGVELPVLNERMKTRVAQEKLSKETPILQRGAKPRDLRSQERAQAVGSSRMGEVQLSEGQKNRKAGIGEVRRAERRQELLDEGRFNRIADRLYRGKKIST